MQKFKRPFLEYSFMFDISLMFNRKNVNDSWAMCRTTDSLSGNSFPVVMTFDGVSKTSQAKFTYQLNPSITAVSPMESIEAYDIVLSANINCSKLAKMEQYIPNLPLL